MTGETRATPDAVAGLVTLCRTIEEVVRPRIFEFPRIGCNSVVWLHILIEFASEEKQIRMFESQQKW